MRNRDVAAALVLSSAPTATNSPPLENRGTTGDAEADGGSGFLRTGDDRFCFVSDDWNVEKGCTLMRAGLPAFNCVAVWIADGGLFGAGLVPWVEGITVLVRAPSMALRDMTMGHDTLLGPRWRNGLCQERTCLHFGVVRV